MASGRADYDAFLSYSHAADTRLAADVQRGLHRFARRWYRPRALRIFRDQTSLDANADLWHTIKNALESSRYFILMASPQAAESTWVKREIEYWRACRDRGTFLIVLSEGSIQWDEDAADFDWDRTTALPRELAGWFAAEPLWVDLTWARDQARLSTRNSSFRSALATLAAPIHGRPKDRLDSEDDRQHQIATWLRGTAVALVVLLGLLSFVQRQEAIAQRDQALSKELAARSEAIGDTDPDLSRLLSLAAVKVSPTAEAEAGMFAAGGRSGIARLDAGGDPVGAVAVSPDGGRFVTAAGDVVRVWDSRSRTPIGDLPGISGEAKSVAFSPDGRTLAVSVHEHGTGLWDVETRRHVADQVAGPRATATYLASRDQRGLFLPDGTTLAVTDDNADVRLVDVATRRPVGIPLPSHNPRALLPVAPSLAVSPDGRTLVTATNDGVLRFWDTVAQRLLGDPIPAYPPDRSALVAPALAVSPDGTKLASAGTDGTIRFWDMSSRQPMGAPMFAHTRVDRISTAPSVAFSPDGGTLATGSQDGTIRLWEVGTRRLIGAPLAGHTRPVTALAFNPDGRILLSGAKDGTARQWDVSGQLRVSRPMSGHVGPVYSAAFSPDGHVLATGGDYGWTPEDVGDSNACGQSDWLVCLSGPNWLTTLSGVQGAQNSAVMQYPGPQDPPRQGVEGPPVRLWDAAANPAGSISQAAGLTARSLAFSPDGSTLAVAGVRGDQHGARGGVTLWDLRANAQLAVFTTNEVVWSVAFSPDGRTLAVAGSPGGPDDDPAVSLWDVAAKTRSKSLLAAPAVVRVAFSPDGQFLAAGRDDGKVQLFDLAGLHRDETLSTAATGPVGGVAFNATGSMLATAADDGGIRLWDTATLRPVGEPLAGHTGAVFSVAFSPDGRLLASGSGDNSVRLWDIRTGQQVGQPYLGHFLPVRAVAFSVDGRTLASVGEDHSVREWDLGYTTDIVRSLCDTTRRSLTREEWQRYVPEVAYQEVCG